MVETRGVTERLMAHRRKPRGIDVVTPRRMAGWIAPNPDGSPTRLRLTVNHQPLGDIKANQFRRDLTKVVPEGRAAFDVKLVREGNEFLDQLPRVAVFRLTDLDTDEVIAEVTKEGRSDKEIFTNPFGEAYALYQKDGGFTVLLKARTDEWWRSTLSALSEAIGRGRETDIPVQIGYGTLLGHVREGGFIGHDDDLDLILHCGEQPDALSASAEFAKRLETLFGAGRVRHDTNGQAHVRFKRDRTVSLDVFASWTTEGRYFQNFTIAGGVAADDVFPLADATFMGETVRLPRNPEAVLEAIYGPGWREPDPGFKWGRPEEVRNYFRGIHSYSRSANQDYWEGYYAERAASKRPPNPPSQFAAFVTDFLQTDDVVVEFGCGNARDSFFLNAYGWRVHACDYSEAAVAANSVRAEEREGLDFSVCNVADVRSIQAFLGDVPEAGRRVFYSRFFLHAISGDAAAILRAATDQAARPGDLLTVETRIAEDKDREKVTPAHFRRFVEADHEIGSWRKLGWTLLYEVRGTGFAKHKTDDAYVLRMVMRKEGDGTG